MDILLKRRLLSGADRWLVAEVDARDVPGARADRCLVCQCDHVARRLWDYPENWYSLSDHALGALCEAKLADVPERSTAPAERVPTPQLRHIPLAAATAAPVREARLAD